MTPELKTLFHKRDPETSKEAAEKMVKSGKLNRQEREVYNDIRRYIIDCNCTDFTAKELAIWCPWVRSRPNNAYYIIQRRLSGLKNKGKIERTGGKRDGCCIWKLT